VKSSFMTLSSSRVVMRSPGSMSAPTLMLRKPTTPANGAMIRRSCSFDSIARSRALAVSYSRRRWSSSDVDAAPRWTRGAADHTVSWLRQRSSALLRLGMLLFVGHLDQDAAGFHALTVFEMDDGHGFGNRRGQFNGFIGPQCSEGLHTVDEAIERHRFDDHGYGLLSARRTNPKHSDPPPTSHSGFL
jgi:hypothetical protein